MHRLGKGGSLASRQALVHSLAHIESWAVDLAWDIIARFGPDPSYPLPKDFCDDFVKVAEEECKHFRLLCLRLEALGSFYGALPAHDGLWESAAATAGSLPARLAVEHCVHEARGLDILPQTIHRFRSNGDEETAALLESVIYPEEVSHCAAGVRWIKHLHQHAHALPEQPDPAACIKRAEGLQTPSMQESSTMEAVASPDAAMSNPSWVLEAQRHPKVEQWFHLLIRQHFKGSLKAPFNDLARAQAGFTPEWYLPLASA